MIVYTASTNFSIIITDGPYGGGSCSSRNHSHHHGLSDSVYQQNRPQSEFYRKMAAKGVFMRSADSYPFDGVQKGLLGFSEEQFSLPREIDLLVSRQGLLGDIWRKPVVSGFMWVPVRVFNPGKFTICFSIFCHCGDHRSLLVSSA